MTRTILLAGAALVCACASNTAPEPSAAVQTRAAATSSASSTTATTAAENADALALSHLTRILIDATSLYAAAAEDVEDVGYDRELTQLSTARRALADRFQAHIAHMGYEAPEAGGALGAAHRVFMEARTLGNEDTKVAVQEALRGENYLLDELTKAAADTELSADTRAFVSSVISGVRADRDRLQVFATTLERQSQG